MEAILLGIWHIASNCTRKFQYSFDYMVCYVSSRDDVCVLAFCLKLLNLLQGLQRESKDYEKDHYKNKSRKPNNTKIPSLVSVMISLKQIRRLPGAWRSHFDVCFPGYNGGQAVPQHLDTAPAN